MKNLITLLLTFFMISSCAVFKKLLLPSQIKNITIYATQAGGYSVVPIHMETFVNRTFPNSVKQFTGYKRKVYFHKNKTDSIWQSIKHMQTLGHIDTIEHNDETGLYENIRIRCLIKTKKETLDVWINRAARSCIKGDSMYLCPPVLLRQLCYFVPESNICDYIVVD
jgi:hypothetical protein